MKTFSHFFFDSQNTRIWFYMGCGSSKSLIVVEPDITQRRVSLHPNQRRIIESFIVVWLDTQLANESIQSNADIQQSLQNLRSIANELQLFSDIGPCINYINGVKREKVFFLVSGSLGEQCVPKVHSLSQITYICFLFKSILLWKMG